MPTLNDILAPIASQLKEFQSYYAHVQEVPSRSLHYVLRYLLRKSGKQLRPALVYLSAAAAGGISETTRVAAAMVELVHNASLIHDDVVDQAELRRGLPAVYKIWKTRAAVLAGDYMLALGLKLAVNSGQYRFLEYMNHAVQQMSTGELEQLRRARRFEIDEESYFRIIQAKTAELLAVCTATGALSAGAPSEVIDAFQQFGILLGMAFQIRDDILDFNLTPSIGKMPGNDLKEGKVTLPLLYALQDLESAEQKKRLSQVRRARKSFVVRQKLILWLHDTEGLLRAEEKVLALTEQAKQALEPVPDSEAKRALCQLADYLVARKK